MLTKKQKWQQGFDCAQLIRDGAKGHFGAKLAEAYFYADSTNALKLYEAFPEYLQFELEEDEPDLSKAYFQAQLDQFLEKKNA